MEKTAKKITLNLSSSHQNVAFKMWIKNNASISKQAPNCIKTNQRIHLEYVFFSPNVIIHESEK